jgi:hypothetical protein
MANGPLRFIINSGISPTFCVRCSDVNVNKTNSFLKPNFQFVSMSKRNVLFYPYITVIEMKIKTNSFKNHEDITKTKRNER